MEHDLEIDRDPYRGGLGRARSDAFVEYWTKSLFALAVCQRGLEPHAAACASFHQVSLIIVLAYSLIVG